MLFIVFLYLREIWYNLVVQNLLSTAIFLFLHFLCIPEIPVAQKKKGNMISNT